MPLESVSPHPIRPSLQTKIGFSQGGFEMVHRFSHHILTTACLIYSTGSVSTSFDNHLETDLRLRHLQASAVSVDQMIRQPIDQAKVLPSSAADESMLPAIPEPTFAPPPNRRTTGQPWSSTGYCWQSPAFCYSPLYFEQTNLERYGTGPDRSSTCRIASAFLQISRIPGEIV